MSSFKMDTVNLNSTNASFDSIIAEIDRTVASLNNVHSKLSRYRGLGIEGVCRNISVSSQSLKLCSQDVSSEHIALKQIISVVDEVDNAACLCFNEVKIDNSLFRKHTGDMYIYNGPFAEIQNAPKDLMNLIESIYIMSGWSTAEWHKTLNGELFASLLSSGISDTFENYINIIKSDDSILDKKDAAIKWLNGIRKDASTFKDYYEWIDGDKVNWPEPIKEGFGFIKTIDSLNKVVSGSYKILHGYDNDNTEEIAEGSKNFISVGFSLFKSAFPEDFTALGKGSGAGKGLILDYAKNMVTNWIDSIQKYTKPSDIYFNTFAISGLDTFYDTVCNKPTLAIAYAPAKAITSAFGYDLQGAYEEVSDKKGFAAVVDANSQLHDIIKEEATWENWKSGMGIMIDGIKDGIVGGANWVVSGIKSIFS